MNESAYFRELMLRAPACPEWFMPSSYVKDGEITREFVSPDRIFAWPSYYASEVIKAAEEYNSYREVTNLPSTFPLPPFNRG